MSTMWIKNTCSSTIHARVQCGLRIDKEVIDRYSESVPNDKIITYSSGVAGCCSTRGVLSLITVNTLLSISEPIE